MYSSNEICVIECLGVAEALQGIQTTITGPDAGKLW